MYQLLHQGMNLNVQVTDSDVFKLTNDAILDYVVVSVKSQWCIGSNWTQSTCNPSPIGDAASVRRMLISEANIGSMGDYYIRNVLALKLDPATSDYPSCVSTSNILKTKPAKADLAAWKAAWHECLRLKKIEGEMDLTALPSSHPLQPLTKTKFFQDNDVGKAKITLKQIVGGRQYARNGRDITIQISVLLFRRSNPTQQMDKLVSTLDVIPLELNHFGLLLGGDLFLDGTNPPDTRGGIIPLFNDADKIPGIHFDSPVYIHGNIRLPSSDKRDQSTFTRFNSNVYLRTSGTNGTSGNTASNAVDEGILCQHSSIGNSCDPFVSSPDNLLKNYMYGFAKGIDHLIQDEGLEYIAGPKLGGKADSDANRGSLIQTCADSQKSLTNFEFTNDNNLVILQDPVFLNQYTLLWTNNGSTNYTLKNTNRFSTPHNDIPRGPEAQCFTDPTLEERLMRPHIYDNNGGTKILGKRDRNKRDEAPSTLPAYNLYSIDKNGSFVDISSTAASLSGDILINNTPRNDFVKAGVDTSLGECPKKRTKKQLDAIDEDFREKTTAVLNAEYTIAMQDTQNVQQTIIDQLNALKPEDYTPIKPTIITTGHTGGGIVDYLYKIFPNSGQNPTKYTAKALMAVNTKLVFQGVKDGLITTFLEEFNPNLEGTFLFVCKDQLKKIEQEILNVLQISNISQEDAKVQAINTQLTDLNRSLNSLTSQLSQTSPTRSYNYSCNCTTSTITNSNGTTSSSTSCQTCTGTETNPAYSSLQSSISSTQSSINALQNQLASYNYLVYRRNSVGKMVTTVSDIKTDLVDLMGTDGLGRSFQLEEVKGIPNGVSTNDYFTPTLLSMRINLPAAKNQFIREFEVQWDAFDPSFIYINRGAIGEANCKKLELEPGVVGIWALTATNTRTCLELRSTRADTTGVFPKPDYNSFHYQFKKDQYGKVLKDSYSPQVIKPATTVKSYLDSFKTFTTKNHPGLAEYRCRVAASQPIVADEMAASAAGAENLSLKGEDNLSEGALKNENFISQTNHSWYFEGNDPFMDVAVASYDPNYDKGRLEVTVNSTGPEFPVHSIWSTCVIGNNVTFLAGFYVCRNFVIKGNRSAPLEIAGTIIAGRLLVEDSTVATNGLHFRNIYHPRSVELFRANNYLQSEDTCYNKMSEPVWYSNLSDANQSLLDQCVPSAFREEAQALTWSMVTPDCGIIDKWAKSGNKAVISERMACKDEVNRFSIVEKFRGHL